MATPADLIHQDRPAAPSPSCGVAAMAKTAAIRSDLAKHPGTLEEMAAYVDPPLIILGPLG